MLQLGLGGWACIIGVLGYMVHDHILVTHIDILIQASSKKYGQVLQICRVHHSFALIPFQIPRLSTPPCFTSVKSACG